MRRRTEIEEQVAKLPLSEGDRIIIELLLDIRHILFVKTYVEATAEKEDI